MKNLKIVQSCFVKGVPAEAGDILENVDNSVAAELLLSGRAKIFDGKKPEPKPEQAPAPEPAPEPKKKASKKIFKKAKKVDADSNS